MRRYKTKSKNAQEAHEAIRPTAAETVVCGQTDEEKKLYTLIRSRTLASQMTSALLLRTKITANTKEGSLPDFSVTGSRLLFPGWLKIDGDAASEDTELPKVEKGLPLALLDLTSEGKETEPPHRYSEAGLVKELEKRGIGRPST